MSIIERLEKFKLEAKELPDIEYLKNPEIGNIVKNSRRSYFQGFIRVI